jgi:hypothetical protein
MLLFSSNAFKSDMGVCLIEQRDQTTSAYRDPIRETRRQLFGVRQTRVNPDLATRD